MKEGNSTDTRKYVIRPLQLSPGEATTFPISVAEFNIKFAASRLILTENPSQQQTVCLSISGSFIYTDEIGTKRETTLIRLYDFKAEEFLVHDAEGEYSD
jgi:hypothetical protein